MTRAPLPPAERRLLDQNLCLICRRRPVAGIAYCIDCWRRVRDEDDPAWAARRERRRPDREGGSRGS